MIRSMPGPVVIAEVFEVVFLWNRYQGVAPRNVIHVHQTGGGTPDELATTLESALNDNMFSPMNSSQTFTQVQITPLDGTTAASIHTVTARHGAATGDVIPAAAGLLSLRTAQRGSRGRGRAYVGPVCEDSSGQGLLVAGNQSTMQTGWEAFTSSLIAGTPSCHLVVASKKHSDYSDLVSISAESALATQRRRQDQLR
jgi:hypothetical protein